MYELERARRSHERKFFAAIDQIRLKRPRYVRTTTGQISENRLGHHDKLNSNSFQNIATHCNTWKRFLHWTYFEERCRLVNSLAPQIRGKTCFRKIRCMFLVEKHSSCGLSHSLRPRMYSDSYCRVDPACSRAKAYPLKTVGHPTEGVYYISWGGPDPSGNIFSQLARKSYEWMRQTGRVSVV